MAFEERDMSGSLFKRDKTTENQPDYSGPCMVGGQLLEVAAWIKTDRNGKKFMSLKFGPRRERQQQSGLEHRGARREEPPDLDGLDDQVPF